MSAAMDAVKRLIRWSVIGLAGPDDGIRPIQQVQYMGKTGDAVVCFPYGYHANVPAGYPTLMLSAMGKGENRAILPLSWQQRPKESPVGDVVFFCPESPGTAIRLKADGSIEITASKGITVTNTGAPGERITLDSTGAGFMILGTITLTGNLNIDGHLSADDLFLQTGGAVEIGAHVHDENDSGGPTDGIRNP